MNTVLAHGCWDLLHLGHIRHLKEARELGDRLIVSITADRHVAKGGGRPQFSAEQRREALLALSCVDEVIISDGENAVDVIERFKPAIYVKGPDYVTEDDRLRAEIAAVEAVGGRFHITTAEKWSSTRLLRSVRLPQETLIYLESARKRGFLDLICAAFERADKLKIAFIGETIIDEYRYVRALTKPSKEFILATVATGEERFNGGVIAAARHGEWRDVRIVTGKPEITKTRFVDADFSRKIFEVYSAVSAPQQPELTHEIKRAVDECDVCVVMDFGHGMLADAERRLLKRGKFVAVTAQTNAGNFGFNPITSYKGVACICVDEPETRLAARMKEGLIEDAATKIINATQAKLMIVTRGRYGSIAWNRTAGFARIPAFADGGFDTMGAGDAFLAVTAPLLAVGLDSEAAAFAGNVAGGLKTCILGHRHHVGRDDIIKNLEWLLK